MHSKRRIHGDHSIKNSMDLFFQSVDNNHSGMIDIKECTDALHHLDVGLTPLQVKFLQNLNFLLNLMNFLLQCDDFSTKNDTNCQVQHLVKRLDHDGNGEILYYVS